LTERGPEMQHYGKNRLRMFNDVLRILGHKRERGRGGWTEQIMSSLSNITSVIKWRKILLAGHITSIV
jgi:hypothetical protein